MAQIEIKVRQIAESRGIRTSYQLLNLLGVKPAVAMRLWRNQIKQFNLETMLIVCEKLNCQPGDLLVFHKSSKSRRGKTDE